MSDALRLLASFAVALAAVGALAPVAIRLALRTGFNDVPAGYKGHAAPTPYLGGMAVIGAALVAGVALAGPGSWRLWPIAACALALWAIGTLDDRISLMPLPRVCAELAAAIALWASGLGWPLFAADSANLLLTVVWVVAVVNAFNLMDNIDGAAGTVGGVVAAGIGALSLSYGDVAVAAAAFALSGACFGFLRFNLARPARIFLGDGGSMPVGFLLAALAMSLPQAADGSGPSVLVAAMLLVGLPAFDTALVMVSRLRRRVALTQGGRDHLTHRLHARLGSTRLVALAVGAAQAALGAAALGVSRLDPGIALAAGASIAALGLALVVALEFSALTLRPREASAG